MTGADSIDKLLASRAALAAAPTTVAPAGVIVELDLDLLDENPYQPRQWMDPDKVAALAESIRQRGTRQPDQAILVRPAPGGRYWIIAGHRRRAAKVLLRDQAQSEERHLWSTIAAVVNAAATDEGSAFIALEENIQREDLSPVEEGAAYARLLAEFPETTPTKKALAQRLGIEEQRVQRMIRIHEAPQFLKDLILKGTMVPVAGGDEEYGPQRRTRRQLTFKPALEFLRLYEQLVRQQDTKNPTKAAAKAEERATAVIVRALEEGWSLRKIEDLCGTVARGKPLNVPESPHAPAGISTVYEQRGERFLIHLQRYRQLTGAAREETRAQIFRLIEGSTETGVPGDGTAP